MKTIYILKTILFENKVTNFLAEKIIDCVDILKYFKYGSYTAEREDLTAKNILLNVLNKNIEDVKYMDVGANRWRHGNNTYLLYRMGARGVLVEADPNLAKQLSKRRGGDKVYNVAIGLEKHESLNFYILSLPTRSSLDKEYIEKQIKQGIKLIDTINIPCRTLNDIIEESTDIPDFLSIDIEGMDFRVLQTVNYEKYKIKVIVAEKDNANTEVMDEYMREKGYYVYSKTKANIFYVLK